MRQPWRYSQTLVNGDKNIGIAADVEYHVVCVGIFLDDKENKASTELDTDISAYNNTAGLN